MKVGKSQRIPSLRQVFYNAFKRQEGDTIKYLRTILNVLPACFEDADLGVRKLEPLDEVCQALKQVLKPRAQATCAATFMMDFSHIFQGNEDKTFFPPDYGVLSTLGELAIRLETNTDRRMAINMLLADNYCRLQKQYLDNARQVRHGLNATIAEATDRKDFATDICFARSREHYRKTLDFIKALPKPMTDVINLNIIHILVFPICMTITHFSTIRPRIMCRN